MLTPHQLKALNYKNHTSLTSNAGSGKTFVLSKRYLEIALNENIFLRNIAAITFTDKAASELYKKIADQIDEKLKSETEFNKIRKLESIRRQLVSANISTIHSFCIDILREFPVEAKLDANFIPIDEQHSSELIELSIDEVIRKSLIKREDVSNLKYLIRIFASKKTFALELFSLIKNRRNVLNLSSKIYDNSEKKIAEYFFNSFLKFSEEIFLNKKNEIINILKIINEEILIESPINEIALKTKNLIKKLKNENDTEKNILLLKEICSEILTQKFQIKKRKYLSKDKREKYGNEILHIENYFNELKDVEVSANHIETELELAHFGKTLIDFFNKTLEKYEEKKREHGFLDFEDILLLTQEILKNENVRQSLSQKFKFIMIDEYQDTNEIQYQIFLPILEHLKKGNLFVVGDEKQSIYMFRDAELEVFLQTKAEIKNTSGLENLRTLPDSFRMAPGICLFTNKLFENLFNDPSKFYNEVEHSNLVCARDENVKSKIEILLVKKDEKETLNTEAELVSKRILKLIKEEKNNWNDIGILCRKRRSFSELEKTFVKYKIPFVIVGGKGFYQKQIVYDFFNYFSFLLDKNNDTALIGILRSPFFSLSDSEIFEISLIKEKTYWKKLQKFSVENKKFEDISKILNENLLLSESSEIIELLRKLLDESDLLAVLSSKPNGVQEIANVEKLIKLTINFSLKDFNTLYDYVNFLSESINQTEDEAQAAVTDESNSVNIMTLHQSKGLEFSAVFLYKSDEEIKNYSIRSKKITVDKKFGLLTKVPLNQNYFLGYESAPINSISNFISNKKDIAELKRLLYVGITRAKDFLFISASEKNNYKSNCFIGLIKEGLNIDFDSSEFKIKLNLKFLKLVGDDFKNEEKNIEIKIPIIKNLDETEIINFEKMETQFPKKLLLNEIKDFPKGEIISATKAAIFDQCPLKYQLTYEYGFSPLLNQYKSWLNKNRNVQNNFEFSEKEDRINDKNLEEVSENYSKNFPELKGKIIHKILQKELKVNQINNGLEVFIKEELNITSTKDLEIIKFKEDILSDLNLFFNSKIFSELKSFKNYKNEFEIYVKENDYYLYGIIDKIIFTTKKIIIVDYKTDDIKTDEIDERAKAYLTQLKFYSYIVSKFFPGITEFELRLIFIKHPDKLVLEKINFAELKKFKEKIYQMVNDIRSKNFNKNLEHCKKCFFAVKGKCIKI